MTVHWPPCLYPCLDAAAEDDTAEGEGAASRAKSHGNIVARTHNYATEVSLLQLRCCSSLMVVPWSWAA